MLVLSRADAESLTTDRTRADLHERLRSALARQGRTAGTVAPHSLPSPQHEALYVPLLGVDAEADRVSSKMLVDNPANARRGLPSQVSAVNLVDATTGSLLAVIHGGLMTRLRTAITSAVATEALSEASSHRLGLVGAGGLALEHLRAIKAVRDIDAVTVWSRTAETAERFRAEVRRRWDEEELDVVVAASPREVVEASQILCTLTPSVSPIVLGEWLRPGQHLNVVGARPRGDQREADGRCFERSSVFVDHEATVRAESGDHRLAGELDGAEPVIVAELSEVLRGDHPGRTYSEEITLYNSVGTGLQDTVAAQWYLDAARARHAGTEIDFGS